MSFEVTWKKPPKPPAAANGAMAITGSLRGRAAKNNAVHTVVSNVDGVELIVSHIESGASIPAGEDEFESHRDSLQFVHLFAGKLLVEVKYGGDLPIALHSTTTEMSAGDFLIVRPGQQHRITSVGRRAAKAAMMYISITPMTVGNAADVDSMRAMLSTVGDSAIDSDGAPSPAMHSVATAFVFGLTSGTAKPSTSHALASLVFKRDGSARKELAALLEQIRSVTIGLRSAAREPAYARLLEQHENRRAASGGGLKGTWLDVLRPGPGQTGESVQWALFLVDVELDEDDTTTTLRSRLDQFDALADSVADSTSDIDTVLATLKLFYWLSIAAIAPPNSQVRTEAGIVARDFVDDFAVALGNKATTEEQ